MSAELVRFALEWAAPQREEAVLALIEDLRTGGVLGVPRIIAAEAVAEHGALAVPALESIRNDEAYRDSRWQAAEALDAINRG